MSETDLEHFASLHKERIKDSTFFHLGNLTWLLEHLLWFSFGGAGVLVCIE